MAKRNIYIVFVVGMLASFCLADEAIDYIPRISYVDGDVSLQERGTTGWTTVDVNLPIQIGDRLVLDRNGLVEIEIDDGSFLRVNQFSELLIQKLEKEKIVIELIRGEIIARTTDNADYIFLTDAGDVILRAEGLYRLNARDDRSVELIVRNGKARFVNDKLDKKVGRNERIVVYGATEQFVMGAGDRFDDFDNWSDRRDSRYASTRETYRYIPQTVYVGAADLDLYGRWVFVSDYGHCWIPTVYYSGWAPYRSGYWRYSPFWGYTWVSYDPWGWLPYHYGSWAYTAAFGWAWVPGSYWGCSWWAPGRVHWGYWNGYVGWVPCGPGDSYYGYWRGGHNTYINNGVINNYYGTVNTRHNNAVTYVTEDDFRRGRPIGSGVYNRSTVGRSVQRQDEGINFRADESITRELFRRDRVVAGQPKVDPARTVDASYSRGRAGGETSASAYRNAAADSNGALTGRSREVVSGEQRSGSGSASYAGRSGSGLGQDSASVNRGRPDVSRGNVQDRSRSRQAEDGNSGSSGYRRDGGSGSASSSAISSGSSRSGSSRGSTSVSRGNTSSGAGSSGSSRSSGTSRSVDRPSSSSGSSRSSSPPPPTRERKVPSPSDSYSRVFPTDSGADDGAVDSASFANSSSATASATSNDSFNRSLSGDDSPSYRSRADRGRGAESVSSAYAGRSSVGTSGSSVSSSRSFTSPSANSSPAVGRSPANPGGSTRSGFSAPPSRSSPSVSSPSRSYGGGGASSVSRSSSPASNAGASRSSSASSSSSSGRRR